jgi:2-methylisocitrate lyase-like PEP mutase family enzyme
VTNRIRCPLIVDADNGYGNEDNVMRTVYELEYAGAAAMVMEDQIFPKRCGHTENKAIVPLAHYLKKLEAVLNGRQTPMCVIARTDAMDLDEGIMRAKAFHAAGADVTLIDGLRSLDDARRVGDEVPGLKQINLIYGGKTSLAPARELQALGFKVVLYSTPALYVAMQSVSRAMKLLFESHDLSSISDASVSFKKFQDFIEGRYTMRDDVKTKL